jgi:hypothetical protein
MCDTDSKAFRDRFAASGISMREPHDDGSIIFQVYETWAAVSGEELGRRMVAALDSGREIVTKDGSHRS